MSDETDRQADLLVGFYERLAGKLPADLAAVLTIDLNKSVLTGQVGIPGPDRDAEKNARAAAAEEKRRRREEQLARPEEEP